MSLNAFQKYFVYGAYIDYHSKAGNHVLEKLINEYKKLDTQSRMQKIELAIYNMEYIKYFLYQMKKEKYKIMPNEIINGWIAHIIYLERYIINIRFGDNRPASIQRAIYKIISVSHKLYTLIDDMINYFKETRYPLFLYKVTDYELKQKEEELGSLFLKKFKKPLLFKMISPF